MLFCRLISQLLLKALLYNVLCCYSGFHPNGTVVVTSDEVCRKRCKNSICDFVWQMLYE